MNINLQLQVGRREAALLTLLLCAIALGYQIGAAHADGPPDADALTYSGVLEQANGTPFTSTHSIQLQLWKDAAGTQQACAAPASAPADLGTTGRFQLTLSTDCQNAFKGNKDVWTEVFVDGTSTGRSKVGAVPYALEAGAASTAKGALGTQIDSLTMSVTHIDQDDVPSSEVSYTECRNQTGNFVVGACARMANHHCMNLGYKAGFFNGDLGASQELGVVCVR